MNAWLLVLASLVCVACVTPGLALTLARDGHTQYCLVVDPAAAAPEQTAARDLQECLQQVTGATFAIRTTGEVAENAPQIVVGPSARLRALVPDVDWEALGHDGIVIRTVGNKLLLAGGQHRGTLYAVNTFLEDPVGCRWWTSTEADLPQRPTLEVGELNTVYTPALQYRESFFRDAFEGVFATRLKCNGHFEQIPAERGGHYELIGWCHTFYPLLPPERYFAEHPEWYSEINGVRTADGGQICLTNDEARRELTRNVLARIRENPGAGMISVAQNDWGGRCQCDKCRALEDEEGSPSGPLLHFVNGVAEEVEREFPGFLVETLAYQYTRRAPLHVRPRDNVVVRLCSIECDFSQPLASEANADFRDDLAAWGAVAPKLYIWNYVVNFANFLDPHPNMRSWGDDIRTLVDHGAISIFEQGDGWGRGGDFDELRAWVLAHLMWDPSRDTQATIREFLNGYYGAAGPALERYLDVLHDSAAEQGTRLGCFNGDTGTWLPLEAANRATEALNKARAAVADQEPYASRVRKAGLSLDHVWLRRYWHLRRAAEASGTPFLGPADPAAAFDAYAQAMTDFGIEYHGEGPRVADYLPVLQSLAAPRGAAEVPELCRNLAPEDWLDIQQAEFQLAGLGQWVTIEDDPLASDGVAARMPGNHVQWAVQWHPWTELLQIGGRWHWYAVVRVEATEQEGPAFTAGVYDARANQGLSQVQGTLAEAGDGEYHTVDLGAHDLQDGQYAWVAPPGDAGAVPSVSVDRFFLVREG